MMPLEHLLEHRQADERTFLAAGKRWTRRTSLKDADSHFSFLWASRTLICNARAKNTDHSEAENIRAGEFYFRRNWLLAQQRRHMTSARSKLQQNSWLSDTHHKVSAEGIFRNEIISETFNQRRKGRFCPSRKTIVVQLNEINIIAL